MTRWTMLLLAGALGAGCTQGSPAPDPPATTEPTPVASPDDAPTTAAPVLEEDGRNADGSRLVVEETPDYLFRYSWPAEAGAIAELVTVLDRRLERARTTLAQQAAAGRRAARDNGFPYNKYSLQMDWSVQGQLPGWISLSGSLAEYTGGAHGNFGMTSLVWSVEESDAKRGIDMFSSQVALEDAVAGRFCAEIDRLRASRRDAPVEPDEDNLFTQCPGVEETEVVLISRRGRGFDRLLLYVGPYVAGPYAEGAYEVVLEVDAAIVEAVKPEYRAIFRARS